MNVAKSKSGIGRIQKYAAPRFVYADAANSTRSSPTTVNGMVTLAGAPNTYLIRVKIEVVDGPLAGVFTFTDDDSGTYMLRSLPTGLVQVRASYGGRTQTLSADLSTSMTYLPFVF